MKDIRDAILKDLKVRLDPIGIPVKSFVPNNHKTPYIYIGQITTFQAENKDYFHIQGIITVELWSGTNEWNGSIKQPLSWLNDIKVNIQNTTRTRLDVSPYFDMYNLRLDNDQGVIQYGQSQRNWVATVQYEFGATQVYESIETYNVIHNGDNVIFNGENVIHTNYVKT